MEELPNTKNNPTEPMVFKTTSFVKPDQSIGVLPALGFFDMKNFFIIILLIIVIFTYFGINLFSILGDAIQAGTVFITPVLNSIFELLGYTTGSAINAVADVTADVARTGIDIAEGTVQDVGNLLIGERSVGRSGMVRNPSDPRPDIPENSIQKSMTSAKTKWCLVGEYQNKRGCIDVSESDKCLSGEIFPNEEMCISGNRPQFQTNNNRS